MIICSIEKHDLLHVSGWDMDQTEKYIQACIRCSPSPHVLFTYFKVSFQLTGKRIQPTSPLFVPAGPYYNPRPRQRIPRDLAMCVTPSGQFYCSMCNCGAEQETDFRQHLESKQHKAKVSELRYRHEMENLGYS